MMAACFDSSLIKFLKVICVWWKSQHQYLPPEIWEKIFQRLTVKSLGKCICVCKVWKSIITNQTFILAHLNYRRANNNDNDSFFLQYQNLLLHKYDNYMADVSRFKHKARSEQYLSIHSDDKEVSCLAMTTMIINFPFISDLEMVGTCNGLVCFVKKISDLDRIIIMNLSIRKYITLPGPDYNISLFTDNILFGFGFDSTKNDFKVVMFLGCLRVEVYSLATGKWRSINIRGNPSICYCAYAMKKRRLTFVNGALHWMFCGDSNNKRGNFISTFDLAEETFGEMKLPNFWDQSSCCGAHLLARGSCLALAYKKKSLGWWNEKHTYNVCVMKEYGVVDSWNLVFSVGTTENLNVERVLALTSSQKAVVQNRGRIMILDEDMNMETAKALEVEAFGILYAQDYVESLFLINHNAYDDVNNKGILDVRFLVSPKQDPLFKFCCF